MKFIREKLAIVVPLAILAYLGFYVYGLVMGAFSPGELPWFTLLAGLGVAGLVVYGLVVRRRADELDSPTSWRARQRRSLRETRGF